jgi:hypothetical protein
MPLTSEQEALRQTAQDYLAQMESTRTLPERFHDQAQFFAEVTPSAILALLAQVEAATAPSEAKLFLAAKQVIANYDFAQVEGICDEEHWAAFDGVQPLRDAIAAEVHDRQNMTHAEMKAIAEPWTEAMRETFRRNMKGIADVQGK